MIPKKIHYCWFGGKPLDKLGKKCLKSWKKYFPEYEIIEWNESNVDLESCPYVKQAYEAKKWAFVSDYVRFKVLYEQGGVYFDTDVEVIKPFDDILAKGAFLGCENPASAEGEECKISVASGLGMAAEAGNAFYREVLDDYESSNFVNPDGTPNLYTVVQRITDLLKKHGLQDTAQVQKIAGITIYPAEYFCPINMKTGKLEITDNTYSIHRFAASWVPAKDRFRGKVYFLLVRLFGLKFAQKVQKIVGRKQ